MNKVNFRDRATKRKKNKYPNSSEGNNQCQLSNDGPCLGHNHQPYTKVNIVKVERTKSCIDVKDRFDDLTKV